MGKKRCRWRLKRTVCGVRLNSENNERGNEFNDPRSVGELQSEHNMAKRSQNGLHRHDVGRVYLRYNFWPRKECSDVWLMNDHVESIDMGGIWRERRTMVWYNEPCDLHLRSIN